ncbi:MAG: hypothetical protein MZW92_62160 [Comamonadaceae bacterium]|nr:hypothetical protein [Comamonadaceae bacterium]
MVLTILLRGLAGTPGRFRDDEDLGPAGPGLRRARDQGRGRIADGHGPGRPDRRSRSRPRSSPGTSGTTRWRAIIRDRVELTLEKRGDAAVLVSRVRDERRLFHFGDDAVINLTVSVPKTLALDIDDGSGSIGRRGPGRRRSGSRTGPGRSGSTGSAGTVDDRRRLGRDRDAATSHGDRRDRRRLGRDHASAGSAGR